MNNEWDYSCKTVCLHTNLKLCENNIKIEVENKFTAKIQKQCWANNTTVILLLGVFCPKTGDSG